MNKLKNNLKFNIGETVYVIDDFIMRPVIISGIVITKDYIQYIPEGDEDFKTQWIDEEQCFTSQKEAKEELIKIINETYKDEEKGKK